MFSVRSESDDRTFRLKGFRPLWIAPCMQEIMLTDSWAANLSFSRSISDSLVSVKLSHSSADKHPLASKWCWPNRNLSHSLSSLFLSNIIRFQLNCLAHTVRHSYSNSNRNSKALETRWLTGSDPCFKILRGLEPILEQFSFWLQLVRVERCVPATIFNFLPLSRSRVLSLRRVTKFCKKFCAPRGLTMKSLS